VGDQRRLIAMVPDRQDRLHAGYQPVPKAAAVDQPRTVPPATPASVSKDQSPPQDR